MKHGPLSRWTTSMGIGRRQRPGRGWKRQTLGLLGSLALFTAETLDSVEHKGDLSSLQLSTSGFQDGRI